MSKLQIRGEIEAVNEYGIRIKGDWYNYSKYPGKTVQDLPTHDRGETVIVQVNDKWIDRLAVVDPFEEDAPAARVRHSGRTKTVDFPAAGNDTTRGVQLIEAPVTNGTNGNYRKLMDGPMPARSERPAAASSGLTKDEQICRQCCVKAAAEAYQPTGDEPYETALAVITIARELEAWCMGRAA